MRSHANITWIAALVIPALILGACGDDEGVFTTDETAATTSAGSAVETTATTLPASTTGGGGAAVEEDAAALIMQMENLAEGVEVTEISCPDDVVRREGERFTCEAEIETAVTTISADIDYLVDESGGLILCVLRSPEETLFEVITPPCAGG